MATTIVTDTVGDDAPEGVWVHFAVVGRFDSASGLYDVTLYRNGVSVGGRGNVEIAPTRTPLSFGAVEIGWGFRGLLDDVQIYHRALRAEEVRFLFDHPGELPPRVEGATEE